MYKFNMYTLLIYTTSVYTLFTAVKRYIAVIVVDIRLPLLITQHLFAQCSCNSSLFPAAC